MLSCYLSQLIVLTVVRRPSTFPLGNMVQLLHTIAFALHDTIINATVFLRYQICYDICLFGRRLIKQELSKLE